MHSEITTFQAPFCTLSTEKWYLCLHATKGANSQGIISHSWSYTSRDKEERVRWQIQTHATFSPEMYLKHIFSVFIRSPEPKAEGDLF